jgi:DNA-binding SARP family transcriptional activator/tetratricopeptide (TPR) repeat protein
VDVTVRLLGTFGLGAGPPHPLQPRPRALLAGLALQAGRPVTTGQIAAWLWDDHLPDSPEAAIRTYLSRLRRNLAGMPPIRTLTGAYVWAIDRASVDALWFEDLVAGVERMSGVDAERRLGTALALWAGPALADIPATDAVLAERTRLTELRLLAVERRNELLIDRGLAADLVGDLRRLVVEFPFRERFIHQLMVCLDRAGRRVDALREYRDAYQRFREHLGVLPGAELQRLHRSLLSEGSSDAGRVEVSTQDGPVVAVRFRLLGPVEALTSQQQPVRLSPLQRALLAVLLLNAHHPMPADRLAAALWGEPLPAAYEARVRTLVAALRKALEAPRLITTDRAGYRLRLEPGQLDLDVFQQHVEQAEQAARDGRPGVALTHYDEALALWRGAALDGTRGSFATAEAARLEKLRSVAAERRRRLRDLAGEPSPPASPAPRSLPAASSRFVGRDAELAALEELRAGPDRLLLVVGTAGVGKTALVTECAHRWARHFPDGQLFLKMRGFDHGPPAAAAEALPQLLYGLGVPASDIPVDLERQVARYRSLVAGRRILVVLDDVADPEQVRPLLPGEPGCLVLATSRDRLGGLVALDGARRVTLDVLAPAAAIDVLRQAGGAQLDAEPDAAEELARLCGYLPLALRIASARLSDREHNTVRQHVDELRHGRMDRLQFAGDHRATVRGAFDLSYRALPEPARRLFRLLSLVPSPAGLTSAAAAALAATSVADAGRLLDTLARVHLVRDHTPGRFGNHDLLGEYGVELAAEEEPPAERDAAVRRLLDHYVAATDRAAAVMLSPTVLLTRPPPVPGVPEFALGDAAEATAWTTAEWDNLAAAVEYASRCGPADAAWHLADALRGLMYLRGTASEWLAVTERGLAAACQHGDARAEAAMRFCLGLARWRMADYRTSLEEYGRALDLYRKIPWAQGEASALRSLAVTLITMGQPREAIDRLHESLAIDRRIGHRHGEAASLNNLAAVHQELGELTRAAHFHEEALPLLYENGQRHGAAIALENLGIIRREQGRLDEALELLDRSLAIGRESGSHHQEAAALLEIGAVHSEAGRYAEATAALSEALALAVSLGEARLRAVADTRLAVVDLRAGRVADALVRLDAARRLATQVGYHYRGHLDVELALTEAYCERGEYETAYRHAEQALTIAERAGSPIAVADARQARALSALGLGRVEQAVEDATEALRTHREAGRRLAEARTALTLRQAVHPSRTKG